MGKDNLVDLHKSPQGFEDHLTDVLRVGARQLLAEAIEVEVEDFLAHYSDRRTNGGRRRVIRNGYLPEREIQTGIGSVKVKMPRVRDTGA